MRQLECWRDYVDEASAFHRRILVFMGYFNFSAETFRESGGTQSDLEKLDAAGVRTLVASIGFGCYFQTGHRQYELAGSDDWLLARQLERIDKMVQTIQGCPRARLVRYKADLVTGTSDSSIGVIAHLTGNNHTLDLSVVDRFFERGIRAVHPAMQYHNRYCSGIEGKPGPALSEFGRQVIARMNELGMVVDTAHASEESALAMIEACSKPVIDSHTTSRDLVPSSRGLCDATLRKLADKGGVVGVHFADHLISQDAWPLKYSMYERDGRAKPGFAPRAWRYNQHVLSLTNDPEEQMRLRRDAAAQERFFHEQGLPPDPELPQIRPVTVSHLADLVNYLVNVAGAEHVGLGGDVNGIDDHQWPAGMDHIGQLPHLTAELLRRGYNPARLEKLYSSNWRRVYSECLPE